ncbi:hypothetical protein C0J52_22766, partial [Blattella germanica]
FSPQVTEHLFIKDVIRKSEECLYTTRTGGVLQVMDSSSESISEALHLEDGHKEHWVFDKEKRNPHPRKKLRSSEFGNSTNAAKLSSKDDPAEEEMASVRQYEESSRTAEDEITLNLIGIEDNFNMGKCFETKANKM